MIGASCAYKTTSFDHLAKTDQAKCLCYDDNGQYNPNPFDDGVSSCYVQATSAKAQGAEKISKGFWSFCSKNVNGGPAGLAAAVRILFVTTAYARVLMLGTVDHDFRFHDQLHRLPSLKDALPFKHNYQLGQRSIRSIRSIRTNYKLLTDSFRPVRRRCS